VRGARVVCCAAALLCARGRKIPLRTAAYSRRGGLRLRLDVVTHPTFRLARG
jgi:hypothetical protein